MKTLLMISAATLFGASAALAQDNQTFITLDSNQDGAVSFDEAVIADMHAKADQVLTRAAAWLAGDR